MNEFFHPAIFLIVCALVVWVLPGRIGRWLPPLAAALAIAGLENIVVLAGGTDGNDGPTDAAGAIVDGHTLARARTEGLDPFDYLSRNDSYHFFQPLEDLVITGPTRTNVMDVYMILVGR